MSLRRYSRTPTLRGGTYYGTSSASRIIHDAVVQGNLDVELHTLQEGERLDTLAGQYYSDARLWWVIAAASGIGWGLQVPPGTRIAIPRDISRVADLVG